MQNWLADDSFAGLAREKKHRDMLNFPSNLVNNSSIIYHTFNIQQSIISPLFTGYYHPCPSNTSKNVWLSSFCCWRKWNSLVDFLRTTVPVHIQNQSYQLYRGLVDFFLRVFIILWKRQTYTWETATRFMISNLFMFQITKLNPFLWMNSLPLCICTTLSLFRWWSLVCFPLLAIVNNTSITVCAGIFLAEWFHFSWT